MDKKGPRIATKEYIMAFPESRLSHQKAMRDGLRMAYEDAARHRDENGIMEMAKAYHDDRESKGVYISPAQLKAFIWGYKWTLEYYFHLI